MELGKAIGAAVGAAAMGNAAEPNIEEENISRPGDVVIDVLDLMTSSGQIFNIKSFMTVSYTHLTLPTNREV